MKTVLVTTRHDAQDDRIYHKEALSLAKRMEVVVVAPDPGLALEWAPRVRFHPIPRREGLGGRLWNLVEAVRAVRKEDPDVCHLHDLDLVPAIPWLRLFTRARIIYDSHEVFTKEDLMIRGLVAPRIDRVLAGGIAGLENLLLRLCDRVITAVDTDGMAYPGLDARTRTIFNYPPLEVFDVEPARVEAAAAAYRGRLPVIYQGTMAEDRGLFQMLEAIHLARRTEPRILLRLIGLKDDELRRKFDRRVDELDLHGHVEAMDWRPHDEIALAMHTSLIGLVPLPSNRKYDRALPIKLLEYMACGLPVVAGNLKLVARYIAESDAGVVVDATRPEELANAMLDLLADPARRRTLGENGRRAVRERWNWGAMEAELFALYESLEMPGTETKT